MNLPGRTYASGGTKYRYGMNGQELEDEVFEGATSAEYWMYDGRLGRRFENDPVKNNSESSYACFNNNPIVSTDVKGLTPNWITKIKDGINKILHPKRKYQKIHHAKGGGKKIKVGNVLKNITRGIGDFFRKIASVFSKTRSNGIPMGNLKRRTFYIKFNYQAPDFGPGESASDPKYRYGYGNTKDLVENRIKLYLKDGSGESDKKRTSWDASGDFNPSGGEKIHNYRKVKLHYHNMEDPDYFAIINKDNGSKKSILATRNKFTGELTLGKSKSGYQVYVRSLNGLTDAPNNSDWEYSIDMEINAWVPYSNDVNGNVKQGSSINNPRPWWHSWWYGDKLKIRE